MAISKAKRSVENKQLALSSQHSGKDKSKTKKKQLARRRTQSALSRQKAEQQTKPRSKPFPGELALQKKILSDRRFVWFPVAAGKTIEKIEFYTSREYHCLRLDFRDRTFLALEITPRFTLNADYQQRAKDEPVPLAEWPAIQSQR